MELFKSAVVFLSFFGLAASESLPKIKPISENISVHAGDSIELSCVVDYHRPGTVVKWLRVHGGDLDHLRSDVLMSKKHEGDDIVSNDWKGPDHQQSKYTLRIRDAKPSDAGKYRCDLYIMALDRWKKATSAYVNVAVRAKSKSRPSKEQQHSTTQLLTSMITLATTREQSTTTTATPSTISNVSTERSTTTELKIVTITTEKLMNISIEATIALLPSKSSSALVDNNERNFITERPITTISLIVLGAVFIVVVLLECFMYCRRSRATVYSLSSVG